MNNLAVDVKQKISDKTISEICLQYFTSMWLIQTKKKLKIIILQRF